MPYIGQSPYQVAFLTDSFSGNGSTTAFTMSVAPANTASVLVVVSGVVQDPTTYSVSGTTLTFSAAPPTGTGNISARYLGIPASGVTTTAYRTITEFTATAGQTTFTPPSYTVGFIQVFRNGVLLGSADYTATNGTTVVLTNGATSGDLVTTISFYISSVLNAIPATAGSVGTTYLSDASVTTSKIVDASVTQAKLGSVYQNNGPAFFARKNANQSLTSGVETVVTFQTKTFDTANCFNATGSTVGGIPAYSFLPNVAGYYQFNLTLQPEGSTSLTRYIIGIQKNGTLAEVLEDGATLNKTTGSYLMYLNGTTDYATFSSYIFAGTAVISQGNTVFSGSLVRAA